MARIRVFWRPRNKFEPNSPDKINASLSGNLSHSMMKFAGMVPFENSRGQNGADTHQGTIRVPLAAAACACLITLGTK